MSIDGAPRVSWFVTETWPGRGLGRAEPPQYGFVQASFSARLAIRHRQARTGGLVEMDERGTVIRRRSAHDPAIADSRPYPYSVLPTLAVDRAVLTTTDMDSGHKEATSQWVQFWPSPISHC